MYLHLFSGYTNGRYKFLFWKYNITKYVYTNDFVRFKYYLLFVNFTKVYYAIITSSFSPSESPFSIRNLLPPGS